MSDRPAGDTDPPPTSADAVRRHVIGHLTTFVRELRTEGADVPANAGIDAALAIRTVGLADRGRTKAALRATLVSRERDLETFDRLFPSFWERLVEPFEEPQERTPLTLLANHGSRKVDGGDQDTDVPAGGNGGSETTVPSPESADGDDDDPFSDPKGQTESPDSSPGSDRENEVGFTLNSSTYSQVGQQQPIDLGRVGADDGLASAVEELTRAIGNLKGRRWETRSSGSRIDARRALRRSFGSGGTVPDIPLQARRRTAVRAVVLVDVSRSVLDTIDRGFLLRFLRSTYDDWRDVRIFFFDTDLRDVTDRFAVPSIEEALLALQRAEAEWGGGTRIGNAFATVREDYPYAIDRETTVFVISDGLEVAEVDQLKAEMARISRRSNAVFWLNPLAGTEGYEPTYRGMAAALPYVDGLFAFTDVADVEEIARQLRLRGAGESIGYRYDPRTRISSSRAAEREH